MKDKDGLKAENIKGTRFIDLTGLRFSRIIVTKLLQRTKSGSVWEIKCDCGNIKTARTSKLKNGEIKSCGCYRAEMMARHVDEHKSKIIDGKKKCSRCKKMLFVSEFDKNSRSPIGLMSSCKSCRLKWYWYNKFGLSPIQAEHMLAMQNRACMVCVNEATI